MKPTKTTKKTAKAAHSKKAAASSATTRTKKISPKPARPTRLADAPAAPKGAVIPASAVKPGERYRGVKRGIATDYVVAKVGPGADPIVAFYIPDRHHTPTTRTTVTTIRWSLFLRDYKGRRLELSETLVKSLSLSPAQKAARTDRH